MTDETYGTDGTMACDYLAPHVPHVPFAPEIFQKPGQSKIQFPKIQAMQKRPFFGKMAMGVYSILKFIMPFLQ